MEKKFILSLLFYQIIIVSYGQQNYYTLHGTTCYGANVFEGNDISNSKYCQVIKNDQTFRYSPYEVSDYGFKNGREYFSKEIKLSDTITKVFMERLCKGSISLYYYCGPGTKKFYIENKTSGLIELMKDSIPGTCTDFKTTIRKYATKCKSPADVLNALKFNKSSLKKYFDQYEYCDFKHAKFTKYGIVLGYNSLKLKYNNNLYMPTLEGLDYKADKGLSIGLFYEKPIRSSDFSLYTELYLTRHKFSLSKRTETMDVDFLVNTTSLILPVTLKYTLTLGKIRPFANLGVSFLYNAHNKSTYYEVVINKNVIELSEYKDSEYISDLQIGTCLGAGVEYKLNSKNSLLFGFRYSRYNDYFNKKKYKSSEISINVGISF